MKYIIALALLFSIEGLACPDLTGRWMCETDSEEWPHKGIAEYSQRDIEGGVEYTIKSFSEAGEFLYEEVFSASGERVFDYEDIRPNEFNFSIKSCSGNMILDRIEKNSNVCDYRDQNCFRKTFFDDAKIVKTSDTTYEARWSQYTLKNMNEELERLPDIVTNCVKL